MTEKLIQSYNAVHEQTWKNIDFQVENLATSRNLFTTESLATGNPITKKLHVFAYVFGIPFSAPQQKLLEDFQNIIKRCIGISLAYYVKPENMGLELAVIKWPDDNLNKALIDSSIKIVEQECKTLTPINLEINGFQINPDGCFVARGVDKSGEFLSLRNRILQDESVFPRRQSGWTHIPLGRVLEPISEKAFKQLKAEINSTITKGPIKFGEIGSLKLIEETQWYMEEKVVLKSFK